MPKIENVFAAVLSFLRRDLTLLGARFSPLDLLLELLLPLGLTVGLYLLVLYLVRRFILRPLNIDDESKRRVLRTVRLVLRIGVALGILLIAASFLGSELLRFLDGLWRVLTSPFYEAGSSRISIITVIMMIPVFYIATWISSPRPSCGLSIQPCWPT
jgi:hypothetical protein